MAYLVYNGRGLEGLSSTEPDAKAFPGRFYIDTSTGVKKLSDGSSWVSQVVDPVSVPAGVSTNESFLFNVWGNETNKAAWPAATTVAYSFTAVDVSEYSTINLVCLMETGSVTLNVDVGWSASGVAGDIHTTDSAVLAGTGTGIGAVVTPKDLFMHIIGTQTGTVEDSYIYISGRSVS